MSVKSKWKTYGRFNSKQQQQQHRNTKTNFLIFQALVDVVVVVINLFGAFFVSTIRQFDRN